MTTNDDDTFTRNRSSRKAHNGTADSSTLAVKARALIPRARSFVSVLSRRREMESRRANGVLPVHSPLLRKEGRRRFPRHTVEAEGELGHRFGMREILSSGLN